MFQGIRYDFSDANVLVTGGSNGIGLACAKAYLAAGAAVTITGRQTSADDYPHDLTGFQYLQLDVGDRRALQALAKTLTRLDILVNNAGGVQGNEWDAEGFEHSLQINLASAFHLSNACKPMLMASQFAGGASIIGIASMASFFGSEWTPAYGPAKAGLVQLTKTLGHSWGKDGIRANAVAAGVTRTNLTQAMIEQMPEMVADIQARQGLKRVGEPDDIAAAVLFLSSPAASWICGQTLMVDGGFSVGM